MHAFREMGLECFEPFGAFYVFPCIKEFGMTSEEFASRFLEEERVAAVPGNAFGESGEGYLRIRAQNIPAPFPERHASGSASAGCKRCASQ